MILIDAGPLVALLNADDAYHDQCVKAAETLPPTPLVTTWPCFTEAMYLLGDAGGHHYQAKLWEMVSLNRIIIQDLTPIHITRMITMMDTYQDTPMDMADASMIAIAETLSIKDIFTLDSDFYVYRLEGDNFLNVIP